MDCLFCKIIAKEIPAEMVYEDDHAVGILDIHPCAPHHTIIIPKRHVETMLGLRDVEIGPFFVAVKNIAAQLKQQYNPDGFTIGINHGKAGGQAVDHLHIHIIPRWLNDGGGSIHSLFLKK